MSKMKGFDMYQSREDGSLRLLKPGEPALSFDEWAWLGATPLFHDEELAEVWAERYIKLQFFQPHKRYQPSTENA